MKVWGFEIFQFEGDVEDLIVESVESGAIDRFLFGVIFSGKEAVVFAGKIGWRIKDPRSGNSVIVSKSLEADRFFNFLISRDSS